MQALSAYPLQFDLIQAYNDAMSSADLTTILGNIGLSLLPVQTLVSGLGYMGGIMCVISGLVRLKKVNKQSREGMSVPLAFIFGGAALIYLPSSLGVLSTTLFGTNSVIQYKEYSPYNLYSSIRVMIQTAGLVWFVMGTKLLMYAAEPGKQHGPKGFMFVVAGVLCMNFDYTVESVNLMFEYFISLTMKVV